jgi:hypothetical protein
VQQYLPKIFLGSFEGRQEAVGLATKLLEPPLQRQSSGLVEGSWTKRAQFRSMGERTAVHLVSDEGVENMVDHPSVEASKTSAR